MRNALRGYGAMDTWSVSAETNGYDKSRSHIPPAGSYTARGYATVAETEDPQAVLAACHEIRRRVDALVARLRANEGRRYRNGAMLVTEIDTPQGAIKAVQGWGRSGWGNWDIDRQLVADLIPADADWRGYP